MALAPYTPIQTTGIYNIQPATVTTNVPGLTQSPGTNGVSPRMPFSSYITPSSTVQAAGSVAEAMLDNWANQRTAKVQGQLSRAATKLQGQEFDKRYAWTNEGNAALLDLAKQQHTQSTALEDEVFGHIMANDQAAFDTNLGINSKAFDDKTGALSQLMTAQRAAREEQLAYSRAESARQQAIQDQADTMSVALPSNIGFAAQEAGRASAAADRKALADANATPASEVPSFASDPLLAREFASQIARGRNEAKTDVGNRADLDAYGDAFTGSDRKIADFATAIGQLTNKAAISRSALPAELAVGAVKKANAKDAYDFSSNLITDTAAQRASAASNYYGKVGTAEQQRGSDLMSVLTNYFGNTMDARNALTAGLVGASNDYTNARTGLYNQQIQGTTTTSPLSTLFKIAGNTIGKALGAGG